MLLSAIVPFMIWKLTPDSWHIYLELIAGALLIGALVMLIRYILRERAKDAAIPSRSEYQWPAGWTIAQYSRALLTYLKVAGWRIEAAQASGPDRLLLGLQRERQRLVLMCLRPGNDPADTDLAELETMRQRRGTLVSALVTDRRLRADPDTTRHQPMVLSYAALPDLADVLDGGTEEARRQAASRLAETEQG